MTKRVLSWISCQLFADISDKEAERRPHAACVPIGQAHAQPATATRAARLKIEPYVEGYVDITAGSFPQVQ
jgi:hypothetical protein